MRPISRLRPSLVALPLLASAALAAPAQAEVEPGRNLELNHSIELAVLENYPAGRTVLVEVFRGASINPATHVRNGGMLIASHRATGAASYDINHLGPGAGDCWVMAGGGTPDIKPGDLMIATVLAPDGTTRTNDVDYQFIKNVQFTENPNGTLSGHARGVEEAGTFDLDAPISLTEAGEGEAAEGILMEAKRITEVADDFAFTGGMISPVDGTFSNVGPVPGGPGAGELFIDTVDSSGGGTAITVTNRSTDPPEDTGCGPRRTTALSSNTHEVINLANVGTDMVVGGPRLVDVPTTPENEGVEVTLTLDGQRIEVVEDDEAGTWSATITAARLQALAQGNHELRATFSDEPRLADTLTVFKDTIAPAAPTATPGPGTYPNPQAVTITGEAGATIRYTNNGSTPTAESLTATGPIPVTASQTLNALAVDRAGNPGAVASFAYVIQPPTQAGQQPGGAAQAGGAAPTVAAAPLAGISTQQGRVRLRALGTPPRVKRSRAARYGLRVVMRVGGDAEVVRIRVYRRLSRGRRALIASVFRSPRGAGTNRLSLRDRSLRRKLRIGRYEIEATPGVSRTNLGATSRARLRIVAG